uniref:Uncharacterized protein n=1 Tax=Nothoprocta perdicaria TaxID=30464 RepID=A0A8C6ZJW6_NOTPE
MGHGTGAWSRRGADFLDVKFAASFLPSAGPGGRLLPRGMAGSRTGPRLDGAPERHPARRPSPSHRAPGGQRLEETPEMPWAAPRRAGSRDTGPGMEPWLHGSVSKKTSGQVPSRGSSRWNHSGYCCR